MDEWVSVLDDTPIVEKGFKHVSVTVIAKLKSGREVEAFYAGDNWYLESNCQKIHEPVIAWKSRENGGRDYAE